MYRVEVALRSIVYCLGSCFVITDPLCSGPVCVLCLCSVACVCAVRVKALSFCKCVPWAPNNSLFNQNGRPLMDIFQGGGVGERPTATVGPNNNCTVHILVYKYWVYKVQAWFFFLGGLTERPFLHW